MLGKHPVNLGTQEPYVVSSQARLTAAEILRESLVNASPRMVLNGLAPRRLPTASTAPYCLDGVSFLPVLLALF
jgi:hypothetical protein